jgi:uncharacterized protein (TIGR03382 family)
MRTALLLVLLTGRAYANAPAPWAVCAGKKAGDSCSSIYYPYGRCVPGGSDCQQPGPCLVCEKGEGFFGAEGAATVAAVAGLVGLVWLIRRRRASAGR